MTQSTENQEGLKTSCNEMFDLCRSQINKSVEALINFDTDLAEEVISTEKRVNALDIHIEKDCELFLALYNPVAVDLRYALSVLKINADLERIADHAEAISQYLIDMDKPFDAELLKVIQIERMFETINSMFGDVVSAFENENAKEARKVFKKDKVINKINKQAVDVLSAAIVKDNKKLSHSFLLFSTLKKLERVGDLLKNIAESIIFYIDAKVVRHKKTKARSKE